MADKNIELTEEQINQAIYEKMLEQVDIKEIVELCKQASEKHLTPDHELYKYFHEFNLEEMS